MSAVWNTNNPCVSYNKQLILTFIYNVHMRGEMQNCNRIYTKNITITS
jgi:hypothetical protein